LSVSILLAIPRPAFQTDRKIDLVKNCVKDLHMRARIRISTSWMMAFFVPGGGLGDVGTDEAASPQFQAYETDKP